jgi:beta-glucosidase
MAQQSIVLLKNQDNLLPLSKSLKKIAVVGPNADDESVMLANYYGYPTEVTTVFEGINQKLGTGVEIQYEKGINLVDNSVFKSDYKSSWFKFDGKEGFNTEYFQNTNFEGAPAFVRLENKIDYKWGDGEQVVDTLIARNLSVRWTTVFTPEISGEVTFHIMGDDRCWLFIDNEKQIEADLKGGNYTLKAEKGKAYKIVIEYRQYAENAEIKFDMGYFEKATPQTIASRVKDADAIIFVGGISSNLEGEEMPVEIEGFHGGDRTNVELPAVQTELLKALKATGKPVVFVNMSGSAMGFEWEAENIPAIIQAWYGGQAGGTAIADVLFGDYNPAGRLPVTFYKSVNDLPDFENYSMENRTYRYFTGEALYPFGFGLSYTTFKYENLDVPETAKSDANVLVKVNVINTGKMDGDEVVQLYVAHKNAGFRTPIRALKGFQRIHLKAGETKTVEFSLCEKDLSVINGDGNYLSPTGDIEISVGGGQPTTASVLEGKTAQKTVTFSEN